MCYPGIECIFCLSFWGDSWIGTISRLQCIIESIWLVSWSFILSSRYWETGHFVRVDLVLEFLNYDVLQVCIKDALYLQIPCKGISSFQRRDISRASWLLSSRWGCMWLLVLFKLIQGFDVAYCFGILLLDDRLSFFIITPRNLYIWYFHNQHTHHLKSIFNLVLD